MATGTLAPAFWFVALDDDGLIVPGALLSFFLSGTSTPATVYHDAALAAPWSVPAPTDAAGRIVVYLDPVVGNLKLIVTDSLGVQFGPTVDPVQPSGSTNSGLIGAALGEVFVFGGDPTFPVTATAYPSGATYDKLHAGTRILSLNSANLAAGTYTLGIMGLVASAATITAAIVNLSDGAPDTPLAEATATSLTGASGTSGSITFASAGATKSYGIKTKVSTASGEVWGVSLTRTA